MWYNLTSKLPEPKYNPIYNKDYIPDFDAPLEERGFRVPPPPVQRPDTPWQHFIDEHGGEVELNIVKELDNQATTALHYPEFTAEDLDYSHYLSKLNQGTTYEDWLFTFSDINDQADKLSWYIFEHSNGITTTCLEAGLSRSDLLAILSGGSLDSNVPLFKLLKYLDANPKHIYYNLKKVKSYDTANLFRTSNSVG